jgi:hypothetical protein
MPYYSYDDSNDRFVPLEEAARRMELTTEQVMDLVDRRALRARRYAGWGAVAVEVEPAITNVKPKPAVRRSPPAKARPVK